jgi:hypothetical protein
MNILLWIVQALLALLAFAGGAYKIFAFDQLTTMPATAALSRGGWTVLGVFEMLCAVLLILPWATKRKPILTPLGATALAVESLALAVMYSRYSLNFTADNPLIWVVVMAVMAAFVAYGRYALRTSGPLRRDAEVTSRSRA